MTVAETAGGVGTARAIGLGGTRAIASGGTRAIGTLVTAAGGTRVTTPLGTGAAVEGATAGGSATGVVEGVVTTGAEEVSIAGIWDGEFSGRVRETHNTQNKCVGSLLVFIASEQQVSCVVRVL